MLIAFESFSDGKSYKIFISTSIFTLKLLDFLLKIILDTINKFWLIFSICSKYPFMKNIRFLFWYYCGIMPNIVSYIIQSRSRWRINNREGMIKNFKWKVHYTIVFFQAKSALLSAFYGDAIEYAFSGRNRSRS